MAKRSELHSEAESLTKPLIQKEDDVILNIEDMLTESKEASLSTTLCCIYKVPHEIRHQKEDAYTPKKMEAPRQRIDEAGIHDLLYNTSANDLFKAGVKFKANTNSKCLLDLKFAGSVFEIPQILVDNSTETVFRNMIALEQFKYPDETYIADYALVLDRLINKSIDVDVLTKVKIISNNLGDSSDVARLFNGLGQNILLLTVNSQYFDICKGLNDFYKNPCNKMMVTLRRDYCNTPWSVMASIAGIVLLILTLVQTIFTVI